MLDADFRERTFPRTRVNRVAPPPSGVASAVYRRTVETPASPDLAVFLSLVGGRRETPVG
jgi:hypothetical protein